MPDPNILLWIAAYVVVAAAAAVNPNGIKKPIANGSSIFPIKGNSVFGTGPKTSLENLLIVLFYVTGFLMILY